ncbi:hypothetical protein LTR62_000705 [Meristemomyces frigidus]|uniref:Uncharacterized protein n=1 Tax=Meristemomyces frigidus TaxID=1508187 RepID=A0AAN7YC88_9PEZI|nr:hypothetical protein LTR62_000705 [Meristemomyces frigidus]
MPSLNEDLYRHILLLLGQNSPNSSRRNQETLDTLLSCCLVSKLWLGLAQPILQTAIPIETHNHLQKRILQRSKHQLRLVREVVVREHGRGQIERHFDAAEIFHALPTEHLKALHFFDQINLDHFFGGAGGDAAEWKLIGTKLYSPPALPFDFSNLRQATLCSTPGGSFWTPLLMVAPALVDLTFHGAGWWGYSSYADSPSYLPSQPPPFSLRRLDIMRSHIKPVPLEWLLSSSAESLRDLRMLYLQREWDSMIDVSALRQQGLLPSVEYLNVQTSETVSKELGRQMSDPLAQWSGIKSIYFCAADNKYRAAIIHGISRLRPIPVVELGVTDMKIHDFKGLFKLRKGKLQPGTTLRLITRPSRWRSRGRGGGYSRWDQYAPEYWAEYAEEATELAARQGVELEITDTPLFA